MPLYLSSPMTGNVETTLHRVSLPFGVSSLPRLDIDLSPAHTESAANTNAVADTATAATNAATAACATAAATAIAVETMHVTVHLAYAYKLIKMDLHSPAGGPLRHQHDIHSALHRSQCTWSTRSKHMFALPVAHYT
jgi:hypothetical protein